MNAYSTREQNTTSHTAANRVTESQNETGKENTLQQMADSSEQVRQLKTLQQMANGNKTVTQLKPAEAPIQRVPVPGGTVSAGRAGGRYLGDGAQYHIHFVGGTAHYKWRNNARGRVELDGAGDEYSEERLTRAIAQCEEDRRAFGAHASYDTVIAFMRARLAEIRAAAAPAVAAAAPAAAPAGAAPVVAAPAAAPAAAAVAVEEEAPAAAGAGGGLPADYEDNFM